MTPIVRAIDSKNLPWNPRLAHIRCIAALLVFVFHVFHIFFGHWQPQQRFSGIGFIVEGYTGVSLFFVLSGYLFMSIALRARGRINYVDFIRNRFLRVFPLFLFVFFVSISISRDKFQPQDILYLFFSNIGAPPTSNHFITGAAWTISVEFTFYLIFPFIARFTLEQGARYLLKFLLLLLIFRTGAYFAAERSTHMIYSTLIGRTDQFLIGMMAAYIVQHSKIGEYLNRRGVGLVPLLTAGALLWAAIEGMSLTASYFSPHPKHPAWIVWPIVEAMLWACILVAWVFNRYSLPKIVNRFLEKGGEISYSIYLLHGVIIFLTSQVFPPPLQWTGNWRLDAIIVTVGLLIITWSVSLVSYTTIEAPFLRLRKAYIAQEEKQDSIQKRVSKM